jgi:hypothetical protein
VLFVPVKHFQFSDPGIVSELRETETSFHICLTANNFAKYVELKLKDSDGIFSDNFFDLHANEPMTIHLEKALLSQSLTLEQLREQLQVSSLYQLYD